MKPVKVGDFIMYHPRCGHDATVCAEVVGLKVTDQPRQMNGETVLEVTGEQIEADKVIFLLSGNKWAFSDQVDSVVGSDLFMIDVTHPKIEARLKDDLLCDIAEIERSPFNVGPWHSVDVSDDPAPNP